MSRFNILIADDTPEVIDNFENWLLSFPYFKNKIEILKCPYINKESDFDSVVTFEKIDFSKTVIDIATVDLMWDRPEDNFGRNDKGGRHIIERLEKEYDGRSLIVVVSNKQNDLTEHMFPCNGKTYPGLPKVNITEAERTDLFSKYLLDWQLERISRLNNKDKWKKLLYVLKDCQFEGSIIDETNREWSIENFLLKNNEVFKHIEQTRHLENLLDYYKGPKTGKCWKELHGEHWNAYHDLTKREFFESSSNDLSKSGSGFDLYRKVETRALSWWKIIESIIIDNDKINLQTINWRASTKKTDENSLITKLAWRLITLKLYKTITDNDALSKPEMFALRDLRCLCLLHDKVADNNLTEYIKELNPKSLEALEGKTRNLFNTHLGFSCPNNTLSFPNSADLFPHEEVFLSEL